MCTQLPPSSTEKEVADVLLDIVRQTPDGQISASQLCTALYEKCVDAKLVVQDCGGLKNFLKCSDLNRVVGFDADLVRQLSVMCKCRPGSV